MDETNKSLIKITIGIREIYGELSTVLIDFVSDEKDREGIEEELFNACGNDWMFRDDEPILGLPNKTGIYECLLKIQYYYDEYNKEGDCDFEIIESKQLFKEGIDGDNNN